MINHKEIVQDLKPQTGYVLAVSGGVDSAVLLDILARHVSPTTSLVVAHFNHGIRPTANKTEEFVKELAGKYGRRFFSQKAELGATASEELARSRRYQFLNEVQKATAASAVICAHHQDDFLETVILNFYRGCGRRGLVSLQSRPDLLRPLLAYRKSELLAYAQKEELAWLEDETNLSQQYFRNRIRSSLMPKIDPRKRRELLNRCHELQKINQDLDRFLQRYLKYKSYRFLGKVFPRAWFNGLSHQVACEVVASWLFEAKIATSQKQIVYVVVKLKTLAAGKKITIGTKQTISLTKRSLRLEL